MTLLAATLVLALAVALCHGIGGALQKRGVTALTARLGAPHLSWALVRRAPRRFLLALLTTPTLVAGVLLGMILAGTFLMVLLSLGDGAKTGVFVGALSTLVYVAANVLLNRERLGRLHLLGIGCAVIGSLLIALGGLRT